MTLNDGVGWLPDDPAGLEIRPCYPDLQTWVTGYLLPHYRRPLGGQRTWCARWWQHDEARSRMLAMWRAWEYQRLQGPTGMSIWWLHHADPQMAILLSRDSGPLMRCSPTEHREIDQFPSDPMPPELLAMAAFNDPANH